MAKISTFSTLKTAVADYLDRDDISASGGQIDTWIDLAEEQIYRDLRLRFMESSTSPSSGTTVAIPSDFLELKSAYILKSNEATRLEPQDADWIYTNYPLRTGDGMPRYIAQEADTWIFGPYPDTSYTFKLNYYAKPSALAVTTNESNWLTTNAPDLLLNATLLQSIPYLGMDERAQYWQANYDKAMRRLIEQQDRQRFPSEMALRIVAG